MRRFVTGIVWLFCIMGSKALFSHPSASATSFIAPHVVHVFGDSHSKFSFHGIPECSIQWLGPWTMHRVGRDGVVGLNVKTRGVQENDTVVFVFGEVYARCHVVPQQRTGRAVEEVLNTLVNNYIRTIGENRKQFKNVHMVVFAVLPPTNAVFNPQYPREGTLEERIAITKMLNAKLKKSAQQQHIDVIDVFDRYATKEGSLDPSLSDGNVHIGPGQNGAVKDALYLLLKKYYNVTP